jgi:hypothetical protein
MDSAVGKAEVPSSHTDMATSGLALLVDDHTVNFTTQQWVDNVDPHFIGGSASHARETNNSNPASFNFSFHGMV